MEQKWWVIFGHDGPKHIKLTTVDIWVVYFTYTLTQTLVCIYVYTVKPDLSGHLQKEINYHLMQVKSTMYCRLLQGEHSAILLTFIKLPFVIKILVLSLLSGCLRYVLLY